MNQETICHFDDSTLFSEIKAFFDSEDIPISLKTDQFIIPDLNHTVKEMIYDIERIIKENGKPNQEARKIKGSLVYIANELMNYEKEKE